MSTAQNLHNERTRPSTGYSPNALRPSASGGPGSDLVIDLTDGAPATLTPEALTAAFRRPVGPYISVLKPMVDRLVATIMVVLLSPVILALALLVRVTMGRGVFFEQRRIGYMGRPFTILKFRTMHHSRRLSDVPVETDRRRTHKHPDDPRLTAVGRFMRKWSLDELPQLLNIARGEMSFVGPRPELETIVAKYEPWQHGRHVVRPGLTGLWQVSDRAGGKLLCECTEVDIEYVETISLLTDLRILAQTPMAALGSNRGF